MRELYTTDRCQKGRISTLEQQLAKKNAAEQELRRMNDHINSGSLTIDGKEYRIVSSEEAHFLEQIRTGKPFQTPQNKYAPTRILTAEERKKNKILEFD